MLRRSFLIASCFAPALLAAKDETPTRSAENKVVRLEATVYADPEQIKKLIGDDLDGQYVVIEAKLTPKTEKPYPLFYNDFTLFSDKNGERAWPYSPDQIAGGTALVLTKTSGGPALMSQSNGPVWGGMGGGMPQRMGGNGSSWGNSGAANGLKSEVKEGKAEQERLDAVSTAALPEGPVTKPSAGFLYFPMDQKNKPKNLKLIYKTPEGKLVVEFK